MTLRPELAVLIARVATGWSRVEERVGYIIVQLLRAEAHTGIKMYQALSSSAAQKAVLRAVARDRLSQEMQDRLESLLAEIRALARRRNDIVHGHWDTSPDHLKELVWTDAADAALSYSEFWSGYNAATDFQKQIDFARDFKGREPKRLLYSKDDFEDVLAKMTVLGSKLAMFSLDIQKLNGPPRDQASVGRV
jgi:hypothetical protein